MATATTCGEGGQGLFVEGILGWKAPVHASVEAGFGIGATSRGGAELSGTVFVPHVAARAEINVAEWLRIGVGPSYRFASRGDAATGPISGSSNSCLSGSSPIRDRRLPRACAAAILSQGSPWRKGTRSAAARE